MMVYTKVSYVFPNKLHFYINRGVLLGREGSEKHLLPLFWIVLPWLVNAGNQILKCFFTRGEIRIRF